MVRRKTVMRWLRVLVIVVLAICNEEAQSHAKGATTKSQDAAARALRSYVQMRFENADWKKYSKLTTWPDEPSWDCKWVVQKYEVGVPTAAREGVVIPVIYQRLGLYCYDFEFKPERKTVTINYELVKDDRGWRVNGPVPDYPDISAYVLLKSLRSSSTNARELPDRRAQFSATARKLADVLPSVPSRSQ